MALVAVAQTLVNALIAVPQRGLLMLVRGYRFWLKPWLGQACRFEPTCSAYALEALQQHGAARGAALAGWRLLRCQPWCDGGCDPVPAAAHAPAAPQTSANQSQARSFSANPVLPINNSARGLFTRPVLLDEAPPSGLRTPVNRNQP
jgi:uncharacterized protein